MKNEEIVKNEIRKYIAETSFSNIADIKDDILIFDTGLLDSMGLLFLIEFLNENFNVEVNDDELNPKNFESINSIVSFVCHKQEINI